MFTHGNYVVNTLLYKTTKKREENNMHGITANYIIEQMRSRAMYTYNKKVRVNRMHTLFSSAQLNDDSNYSSSLNG